MEFSSILYRGIRTHQSRERGFMCPFSGQLKSNYYFQSSIVDGATRNMAFPNIYILGKQMLLLIHSIFT